MNSGTLREIQQELNKLVEWQDARDEAVNATEVIEMLRAINPSEWLSVLDPRIQASKARLRALGFIAPAHPGDTARVKMALPTRN